MSLVASRYYIPKEHVIYVDSKGRPRGAKGKSASSSHAQAADESTGESSQDGGGDKSAAPAHIGIIAELRSPLEPEPVAVPDPEPPAPVPAGKGAPKKK